MIRIGIVGAENSHTAAIAKVLNVDRRVAGARVTHVWGETPALARAAAGSGRIPAIVSEPEQMIGEIDGVVVDHRHGEEHLPAARPFLEEGLPLFVDKPFCCRTAEGRRFLKRARTLGVPVCSFSVLPKQGSFRSLQEKIARLGTLHAVTTTGPCDVRSKWGGIFFYGIHQADMLVRLLGYDFYRGSVTRGRGSNHTASVLYRGGAVGTMNLIGAATPAFHVSAIGEKGRLDSVITRDRSMYLAGVREFVHMFATGETEETDETMLGPVAVLEGLEKSLAHPHARVGIRL